MKITDVRIFKKEDRDKKLRAFATITIDECFVVRDIKIINGTKGLFVAMPSRRFKEPCPRCHNRNVVRSVFCNQCGTPLKSKQEFPEPPPLSEEDEMMFRQNEHKDIAHPITRECREYIQKTILEEYHQNSKN